jgi:hypothetical protein
MMSLVVMDLPKHNSSFLTLLGKPRFKVIASLHDWRNNTLQFQSRDGAVVNLKYQEDWNPLHYLSLHPLT